MDSHAHHRRLGARILVVDDDPVFAGDIRERLEREGYTVVGATACGVDAPAVATRDELKLAQTQQVKIGLGILSPHTAAAEWGLDYDAEVAAGAKPDAQLATPPAEPNGALSGALKGAVAEAIESASNIDEARENVLNAIGLCR